LDEAALPQRQTRQRRTKRLRHRLLHTAGRIVRHGRRTRLRLQANWPWSDTLVNAFTRLRAIPALG
jgi:hypothetical protein